MKRPTQSERDYYNLLKGRKILSIKWEDYEGNFYPILMLDGKFKRGVIAYAAVMMDPEGNGPGFLLHNLKGGEK